MKTQTLDEFVIMPHQMHCIVMLDKNMNNSASKYGGMPELGHVETHGSGSLQQENRYVWKLKLKIEPSFQISNPIS